MPLRRRWSIIGVWAAVLMAWPVSAQDNIYGGYGPGVAMASAGRADGRWFVEDPWIATRNKLLRCCPAVSIGTCAARSIGRLPDRYSLRIKRLGRIDGQRFGFLRYRRETLFRDPAFAGVDPDAQPYFSCRASRTLIVKDLGPDRLQVVWEGLQDELSHRLSTIELHDIGPDTILAFTYCVDGTGGCWQELFVKSADAPWRPLEKDESWTAVYADLPAGFSLHKSGSIDFATMTWARAMAREDDPNCCPSGAINMKLAIRNGRLSIQSHEFVIEAEARE